MALPYEIRANRYSGSIEAACDWPSLAKRSGICLSGCSCCLGVIKYGTPVHFALPVRSTSRPSAYISILLLVRITLPMNFILKFSMSTPHTTHVDASNNSNFFAPFFSNGFSLHNLWPQSDIVSVKLSSITII